MARSAEMSTSVRGFFVHLYWTAGEPMTKEKLTCISFYECTAFKLVVAESVFLFGAKAKLSTKDCIETVAY